MRLANKKNKEDMREKAFDEEQVEEIGRSEADETVLEDEDGQASEEQAIESEEVKSGGSAMEKKLAAYAGEREDYKNALIRERADFENYKKRNAALSANSYNNGVADTVNAILPVLDNFERALASECVDKAFLSGMEMIMRQLIDTLSSLGVKPIDTDCAFDPNYHNAVAQVEDENCESNYIVETMQKGYTLKDRILRHAMVKVNK